MKLILANFCKSLKVQNRTIITIDGLSGSGKTTIGKLLATELKGVFLSSGLVYRALAFLSLREKIDQRSIESLVELYNSQKLSWQIGNDGITLDLIIESVNKCEDFYTPEISHTSSVIAQHQIIRDTLRPLQQKIATTLTLNKDIDHIVVEGRDMGTVVFPEAKCKFFLIATSELRQDRRRLQLAKRNIIADSATIFKEVADRDLRDAKNTSFVDGTIKIMNDKKSPQQIVAEMISYII
jgi:CMP/dCMP kinase